MLQGIEIIFEDRDKMMAHLKKKTYKEYTENFIQNHGHYFEEMTTYVEGAKDKEAAAKEIGECLASAVKKTFVNKKGKIGARTQSDLNFFMIYYVFPTSLSSGSEYAKTIADGVCEVWKSSFANSDIGYTDYDSLYDSFREKIFGIF